MNSIIELPAIEDQYTEHENSMRSHKHQFQDITVKKRVKLIKSFLRFMQPKKINHLALIRKREGYVSQVDLSSLYSFSLFCQALSINKRIKYLNISRCLINIYFAIELSTALQENKSLLTLNIGGCGIDQFGLSRIFKCLSNNQTLKSINFFNNQSFSMDTVQDMIQFLFQGQNVLENISLTHCITNSFQLVLILRSIHNLKNLKVLKLSMMEFNSEALGALAYFMKQFTIKQLQSLDISYNLFRDQGIASLNNELKFNVRGINIQELNLEKNFITQSGMPDLQNLILKLKNLQILNLQNNQLHQFNDDKVLQLPLYSLNLSGNQLNVIPENFFINVLHLDISSNYLQIEQAIQLADVIASNYVQWVELNLNHNIIKTYGFESILYAFRQYVNHLQVLQVADNQLDGQALLFYIINNERFSFRTINFSQNFIRYQLIYAIINMMKENNLSELILSNQNYEEDDILFESFFKQEHFQLKSTNLKRLDLSYNPKMISCILHSLSSQFNKLEQLSLRGCLIKSKNDIEHFKKFLERSSTLVILDLSDNYLGMLSNNLFNILALGISLSQTLNNLNLSNNKLGQQTPTMIRALIECHRISFVNLSKNKIGDNFSAFFFNLIVKTRIQTLFLDNNNVKNQTIDQIGSALEHNQQFHTLSLTNQNLGADEIFSISKLMKFSTLVYLDISGNSDIDIADNNLLCQQSLKVDSLSLDKVQFNTGSFNSFCLTLDQNKTSLKMLQIRNTVFSPNQLQQFHNQLIKLKNLEVLNLHYFSFNGLYNITKLLKSTKKLKTISLHKCSINQMFLEDLTCYLTFQSDISILDLTKTRLSKNLIEILSSYLQQMHIKALILKGSLTNETFPILAKGFTTNFTIELLDISDNQITSTGWSDFSHSLTLSGQIYPLKKLIMRNNFFKFKPELQYDATDMNVLQSELKKEFRAMSNIETVDLSGNIFYSEYIYLLSLAVSIMVDYQLSKILIYDDCQFTDEQRFPLCNFIKNHTGLRELNLSNNKLSDDTLQDLLHIIITSSSHLRILNISNNLISDVCFTNVTCVRYQYQYLILLILSNNPMITKKSDSGFIKMLQNNKKLFILNNWKQISRECIKEILDSFIRFQNTYSSNIFIAPKYMSELSITQSDFDDKLCIYFSKKYFCFEQLTMIDLSQNPRITMYGKVYLYITILDQKYSKFRLQEFYINHERRFPTVFDDGLLGFILEKLKYFVKHLKFRGRHSIKISNQLQSSKQLGQIPLRSSNSFHEIWIDNRFAQQIINIINIFLKQQAPSFNITESFLTILQNRHGLVKIYLFVRFLIQSVIVIFSVQMAIQLVSVFNKDDGVSLIKRTMCLDQKTSRQNFCLIVSLTPEEQQINSLYTIEIVFLSIFCASVDHFIISRVRSKIKLDHQIITPNQIKYLQIKNFGIGDILSFIIHLLNSMNFYFYFIFLGRIRASIQNRQKQINDTQTNQQDQDLQLTILESMLANNYVLVMEILVQLIYWLYFDVKSLIRIFRVSPSDDKATYLTALWEAALNSHNYNVEEFLATFCPQPGYKICKLYASQRQITALFQAIFFELPILIVTINYIQYYQHHLNQVMKITTLCLYDFWLYAGIIREIIKLANNLKVAFMTKPPSIKQYEFNESLVYRRYKQQILNLNEMKYNKISKGSSEAIDINKLDIQNTIIKTERVPRSRQGMNHEENADNPKEQKLYLTESPDILIQEDTNINSPNVTRKIKMKTNLLETNRQNQLK